MSLTTDPKDPRLGKWDGKPEEHPAPPHDVYLVLSEEERAKGFVRPYRDAYVHVGPPGHKYELRDLTLEERERFGGYYAKFEEYPAGGDNSFAGRKLINGRFWTQEQLDAVDKGCGTLTRMGRALSETYAREPGFYGATYCCGCGKHFAVGRDGEFVWSGTDERVGT